MLDLACLCGRIESRQDSAGLRDAMLDGYDQVRPLPAGYLRDLRVMLAFRRFDYAGWILSWPRIALHAWGPDWLAGTAPYIARQLAG